MARFLFKFSVSLNLQDVHHANDVNDNSYFRTLSLFPFFSFFFEYFLKDLFIFSVLKNMCVHLCVCICECRFLRSPEEVVRGSGAVSCQT